MITRLALCMFSLCLLTVPCCRPAIAGDRTQVQSYEDAIARSESAGIPLVVFFEGQQCPPCKAYWNEVIEPMRAAGELDRVALAKVVVEDRPQLAMDSKVQTTPTVLAYVRRDGTWVRYRMRGMQSRERLKELLERLR